MTFTKELISALMKSYGNHQADVVAAQLTTDIEQLWQIRVTIREAKSAEQAARTRWDAEMGEIRQRVITARRKCPHPISTISTGSIYDGSVATCDVCGEEL